MLPIALSLLVPAARAESVLEFKTQGPVAIFVDGKQATLTGNLRQRVAGLDAGVHDVKVAGVFGKTLYEAEIDLPDDTITTASWEHGQIKVLTTDWLPEDEEDAPAEETVAVEAPAEEPVAEEPIAEEPVAEEPVTEVAEAAPADVPLAVPAAPVAAAPVAAVPVAAEGTVLPSMSKPRTVTIQATDGMRIEVVHDGKTVTLVVDGEALRIEDGSGLSLAIGAE